MWSYLWMDNRWITRPAAVLLVVGLVIIGGGPRVVWHVLGEYQAQFLILLTAALAWATYGLFKGTADLAAEARAGTVAIERQYQQSLSGRLVIKNFEITSGRRNQFDVVQTQGFLQGPTYSYVRPCGELFNVGGGPAFRVRAQLIAPNGGIIEGNYPGDLNANEKHDLPQSAMVVSPIEFIFEQSEGIVGFAKFEDHLLRLTWYNVFGASCLTEYTCDQLSLLRIVIPFVPSGTTPATA